LAEETEKDHKNPQDSG